MEIPSIAITRRAVAYETGHLQLVQLTCQRPDGSTCVWDAVERPGIRDVVAAFPVTLRRTVILIEQFRAPVGTRVLELPAGLCDKPSEPLEIAVLRELEEETGCVGSVVQAIPPSAESSGSLMSRLHLYLIGVIDWRSPRRDVTEEFMAPIINEFQLDDLPAALLRYALEHPGNLIDPKILAGYAWWKHYEGGGA